jgi:DNA-binding NarL/FixJ family response regulator
MGRRPIVASVIVLIVLSLQVDVPALESSSVQGPRLEGDQSIPSGAEFPPQDEQVLSLLRKGSAAKSVRRRLTRSPDTPETIRLVAIQERTDEMLRALELLVRATSGTDCRGVRIAAAEHE